MPNRVRLTRAASLSLAPPPRAGTLEAIILTPSVVMMSKQELDDQVCSRTVEQHQADGCG